MNETLIYTDSRPRAKSTGHAFGFEGNLGMPVIISGMLSVFILTLLLNGDNRMPLFAKFLLALLRLRPKAFGSWVRTLREFKAGLYDRLLPGHGVSGGPELYDGMIGYLTFAREALAEASSGDDFRNRLIEEMPDFGGPYPAGTSATFSLPQASHRQLTHDREESLSDSLFRAGKPRGKAAVCKTVFDP